MVDKPFQIFHTSENRSIAYVKRYSKQSSDQSPGIIFLGGLRSDMQGTKASYLEKWCFEKECNFLKFDYSGHGQSSETFESGCISDWKNDACEVLDNLSEGPQILIGSSMGGWISLLLGNLRPKRIMAFIGVATAPDFTETSMWANLDVNARNKLNKFGKVEIDSNYSDEPYIVTKKLIEDGRSNLIMNTPLLSPFPIRLLQGMLDNDVHYSQSISLAENISHNDVKVVICKDADHQFSSPACLNLLTSAIQEFL